jgi:hypothetical protein
MIAQLQEMVQRLYFGMRKLEVQSYWGAVVSAGQGVVEGRMGWKGFVCI